ncbi:aldo-keto reductase [Niveomyces insectorum RCEF 264]|uniref:Aldo-keto reductase n=1 Tax=Niveomyces insectorum RCEF 264 TaxID=1081102 RepID=A0A167ZRM1_9HYPO|nr:aldo-keto reductase [Niveomyces insectorum RCEF 264]
MAGSTITATAAAAAAAAAASIPRLVYGTAWKRDRTADLVYQALAAGFRGLDTAAQPRHYREDLVAAGVRRALAAGIIARRADLYIQTKFSAPGAQDWDSQPRPPYDRAAPLAEQVQASVEVSLRNFTVEKDTTPYLDCLVLHAPLPTRADTQTVLAVLRPYMPQRIRTLGISNATLAEVEDMVEVARSLAGDDDTDNTDHNPLVPVVVQNRFHRGSGGGGDPYDVALRRYCGRQHIVYQAFWTLTANPDLLRRTACVQAVVAGAGVAAEAALYSLVVLGLGTSDDDNTRCPVVVLDGTTSPEHMAADLAGLVRVAAWRANEDEARAAWKAAVAAFRARIGDV